MSSLPPIKSFRPSSIAYRQLRGTREVSGASSCMGLCMPGPGYSKAGLSPLREGAQDQEAWGVQGALRCLQWHECPLHLRNCQAPMTGVLRAQSSSCTGNSPHQAGPLSFQSNLILSPHPHPAYRMKSQLHRGPESPAPALSSCCSRQSQATRTQWQRCGLLSPERPPAHACSPLPAGATPSLQGPTTTRLFHATDTQAQFLRTRHQ